MNKLKSIFASSFGASLTIVSVVAMTIGAELSVSFKNWLAQFTGHHWVTKSWVSIFLFLLFFTIIRFSKKTVSDKEAKRALFTLELFSILGFISILGFYLYEFFSH